MASGLSKRNISAATGVSASASPGEQGRPPGRTSAARSGRSRAPSAPRRWPGAPAGSRSSRPKTRAGELHHPERERRLVDGDEVGGVEAAEEEGVPALRAGLDRRRVVLVGPALAREVPQIEQRACPRAAPRAPGAPSAGRPGAPSASRRRRERAGAGAWRPRAGAPGRTGAARGGAVLMRGASRSAGRRPRGGSGADGRPSRAAAGSGRGSRRRWPTPARRPRAPATGASRSGAAAPASRW